MGGTYTALNKDNSAQYATKQNQRSISRRDSWRTRTNVGRTSRNNGPEINLGLILGIG